MTATSESGYTPAYTLDNAWRAARDRLTFLELACDPLTTAHLDQVGVGPGWHCLEVGAGAGSVVRMLCHRVGPTGQVLAVDLEPRLLADLTLPNLEVRQLDVVIDELPEAAFDFVHTRAVLLHIPQRDEVMAKLLRALKPGGVALFEEVSMTEAVEKDDIFGRSMRTMYRPMLETGTGFDLHWANTLPEIMGPAGFVDVGSVTDLMTFTGGEPLATFFSITWLQFLESQPYTDAERAQLEECRVALAAPGPTFTAWKFVAAWGRRP